MSLTSLTMDMVDCDASDDWLALPANARDSSSNHFSSHIEVDEKKTGQQKILRDF